MGPLKRQITWYSIFFGDGVWHLAIHTVEKIPSACGLCQTTMPKFKMTLVKLMSKSTQRHMITHTLTSHHFYSLNEHACQIPLKVQVTKTIQMPCFFGVLVKQGPFHYHYEWEQCHFCLPAPAKLGENNSGMYKQKQNSYWHTITAHCIPPQII